MTKKDTYIFDLDGTIANIDARRKLCAKPNGKMDFNQFFDPKNIDLDLPNDPVIQTLQMLDKAKFNIVIFSGRSKATKDATVQWLKKYDVPFNVLKMRPTTHPFAYMKDDDLKKHWLDTIFPDWQKNRIVAVFDDRDQVVKMWRSNNIPCFQVNYGDFQRYIQTMQKNNYEPVGDLSNIVLSKEQEKQISDSVNRFFRMRRKRIVRKATNIILYPIAIIWKPKT